ncbi:MAG: radical SAM protein, partial [Deltaproteobacteria bacterium]|nr:radical SAM protein [Deltaproteobacteria bacterium]
MNLLYNNSKSGVYIHVPFCRRRCSYCDFYFEIGRSRANFERYIQQEWDFRKDSWPFEPQTLYFGGGTPSLLVPEQIGALIRILAPNAREITLEANPEDLNPEYLKQIRQLGVNRLSLGIQSFEDPILTYLGRNHSSKQAKECISQAQEAGFKRISVDIIAGVPGENLEPGFEWLHEQKIGHISSYLLTVEPNTPLVKLIQKKRRQEPQHDFQADAYGQVQNQLKILGYEQYEVSSYALPGQESQ